MTPLEAAHAYLDLGLRPIPIQPTSKVPALKDWANATPDAASLHRWWNDPERGVGIALGPYNGRHIFAIDIDGDSHGVDGESSWADYLDGRDEPDTWEAVTGGGGRHLIYMADHEIRNGDTLGAGHPGVDTRGDGGQILVYPTVHPTTGCRYEWVDGHEPWNMPPADAPMWLVDDLISGRQPAAPLAAPKTSIMARSRLNGSALSPGDDHAQRVTWAELLEPDGWTLHHVDRLTGCMHWTRPGKEHRDGSSATTGHTTNDNLHMFSSSVPGFTVDETVSKLHYVAVMRHHGDHALAALSLKAAGYGLRVASTTATVPDVPAEKVEGWPISGPDEIGAVLSGEWTPTLPTLLRRLDGEALLYAGKVNSIAGEPGCGKTWIALAVIAQVLDDGGIAVFIDHEDRLDTQVNRLRSMGVSSEVLTSGRFRYVTPTFALKGGALPTNVIEASDDADVVCIDSMGEALAHSQLNQNNDDEVAHWMAATARRLADGGACVLILDHVTKDTEGRGRWAIGSQRKLAAIDGIMFMVKVITAASKDRDGKLILSVSKDRHGNFPHGTNAAEVHICPAGGDSTEIRVEPMGDGPTGWRPTGIMELVSEYLESAGVPVKPNAIAATSDEGGLGKTRAHVLKAISALIEDGNIERGTDGLHIIRPYREVDIGVSQPVVRAVRDWFGTGSPNQSEPNDSPESSGSVVRGVSSPNQNQLGRRSESPKMDVETDSVVRAVQGETEQPADEPDDDESNPF